MLPVQPNQGLINGLACLQAVVTADAPIGSRELARALSLEHTRVNRLLGTLTYLGFVNRTANRKYRPGPGIHVLSAQSLRGSGLLAASLPHLQDLASSKLTIALGVLWEMNICYLVHAARGKDPASAIGAHQLYPAHESILGIAILSSMGNVEIRRLARESQPRISSAALDQLLRDASRARKAGFALKKRPNGSYSLASSIRNAPGAAIGVSEIASMNEARELSTLVLQAAESISGRINE